MASITVRPAGPLHGEVTVGGAKNSVLKLMAATILADGHYELTNVPGIVDVDLMRRLLVTVGVDSRAEPDRPGVLILHNPGTLEPVAPQALVSRMRASTAVLGPLLARCGRVRLPLPGGDDFGSRPIDYHVAGLEALGARFTVRDEHLEAVADDGLRGADIALEFPSVGATENLIMAATLAKGTTTLDNAAREPEIVDLCHLLIGMGAQIEGIGSPTVVVHGVTPGDLHGTAHRVVADRVEAATYLAAVGLAGGEIVVRDAPGAQMEVVLRKFAAMGLTIEPVDGGLRATGPEGRLRSTDVATLPYPGVATDYKPLITAMLTVADGVGIVTENLFAGRFRYVDELLRMGADIRTDDHHAVVRGVDGLVGAAVVAPDIRAGAALVVAALAAEGETQIDGAHHVDRGYEDLVGKLRILGADITRSPR
jgi:UDP-N-acetylglucosamine 1-carboxyvinyltransferase